MRPPRPRPLLAPARRLRPPGGAPPVPGRAAEAPRGRPKRRPRARARAPKHPAPARMRARRDAPNPAVRPPPPAPTPRASASHPRGASGRPVEPRPSRVVPRGRRSRDAGSPAGATVGDAGDRKPHGERVRTAPRALGLVLGWERVWRGAAPGPARPGWRGWRRRRPQRHRRRRERSPAAAAAAAGDPLCRSADRWDARPADRPRPAPRRGHRARDRRRRPGGPVRAQPARSGRAAATRRRGPVPGPRPGRRPAAAGCVCAGAHASPAGARWTDRCHAAFRRGGSGGTERAGPTRRREPRAKIGFRFFDIVRRTGRRGRGRGEKRAPTAVWRGPRRLARFVLSRTAADHPRRRRLPWRRRPAAPSAT